MRPDSDYGKPNPGESREPSVLALLALAWTLADDRRADRLLALTGMDADILRAGVGNPAILRAVLAFLADHEPDLIACAESIETTPEALIAARRALRA